MTTMINELSEKELFNTFCEKVMGWSVLMDPGYLSYLEDIFVGVKTWCKHKKRHLIIEYDDNYESYFVKISFGSSLIAALSDPSLSLALMRVVLVDRLAQGSPTNKCPDCKGTGVYMGMPDFIGDDTSAVGYIGTCSHCTACKGKGYV